MPKTKKAKSKKPKKKAVTKKKPIKKSGAVLKKKKRKTAFKNIDKKQKPEEELGAIFDSTKGSTDALFINQEEESQKTLKLQMEVGNDQDRIRELEDELLNLDAKFCDEPKTFEVLPDNFDEVVEEKSGGFKIILEKIKKFFGGSKNLFLSLLIGLVAAGLFSTVVYVFALPYSPGETTNPTCAPGDTDCTVTASVPYTGATAAVNLGARNFTTTGAGSFASLTLTTSSLTVGNGGTGLSTIAAGSVLATNAEDTLSAINSTSGTKVLTNTDGTITWETASSGMTYPGAGIAVSTGSAWGTSLSVGTDIQAYDDELAGLAGLTYSSGTPFVKMTAAGTFSLDTNTYLTSLSGALLATGATTGATSQSQVFTNGVTLSNLTSGRVPYATTGGAITDSSKFSFDSTNGTLTVQSSTTNPTIYNSTNDQGVILRAAASTGTYGQLRIVSNGGGWADSQTTTYFQATNGSNNNMTFMGGTYGADTQLTRLQFNSLYTTFTDTAYTATPAPTALFEAINSTAAKVAMKIRGASGQSAHYLDINSYSGTGGDIFAIDSSGNVGIGTTSPGELLSLGTAGTTAGVLSLAGATSGKAIIAVSAEAGTPTLTLPTTTGTLALTSDLGSYVPYTGATGAVALGANTLSTTSGIITPKIYPASDSTTAVQINKADGTTNVLNVDTTNARVGIGTTSPAAKLDVISAIQSSGAISPKITIKSTGNADADAGELQFLETNGTYGWAIRHDALYDEMMIGQYINSSFTEVMRFDNNTGNVGIGTTSPSQKLQIENSGTVQIRMYDTLNSVDFRVGVSSATGTPGFLGTVGAFDLNLRTDNTDRVVIKNTTGYVGIGTTAPGHLLDIATSSGTSFPLKVRGNIDTAGGYTGIVFGYEADTVTYEKAAIMVRGTSGNVQPEMHFLLDNGAADSSNADINDARLSILPTGNVGIGTTAPGKGLHIYSTAANSAALKIERIDDSTGPAYLHLTKTSVSPSTVDNLGYIQFEGNDSAANATIYSAIYGLSTGVTDTAEEGSITFNTFNAGTFGETMRIKGGNVGIGTTSPGAKLEIARLSTDSASWALLTEAKTTYTNAPWSSYLLKTTSTGDMADGFGGGLVFAIQDNAAVENNIATIYGLRDGADNNGAIAFNTYTGGVRSEKMRITNAGNVGIGTASPSYPLHVVGNQYLESGNLGIGATPYTYGAAGDDYSINTSRTFTDTTSGAYKGSYVGEIYWNPSVASVLQYVSGLTFSLNSTPGSTVNNTGYFQAMEASALWRSNGTLTNNRGLVAKAGTYNGVDSTSGTVTNASAIYGYVVKATGSTITNAYGLNLQAVAGTTNAYGVYVNNVTGTNAYDIYANDSSAYNYFAGKVGIGKNNPGYALDVNGIIRSYDEIRVYKDGSDTITTGANYYIANTGNTIAWLQQLGADNDIDFWYYNGSTWARKITFNTSGYIGIGTTSPAQKLHINGHILLENNQEIRFKDSGGTQRTVFELDENNDLWYGGSMAGSVIFVGGGSYTERMKIDDSGNIIINGNNKVGIGTTSPSTILSLGGDAARTIGMERNTTTSGSNLTLSAGGGLSGGTNLNGGSLYLASGISTGSGSSDMFFQTATAGASGTDDVTPSTKFTVRGNGNVVVGTGTALATDATAGFFYIPTTAGTPIGTPVADTAGTVPLVYDTTNHLLYLYRDSAWHYFAETGGFQIPDYETTDPLSGTKMGIGDIVLGMVDSELPNDNLHAKWVSWDSVKAQLLAEARGELSEAGGYVSETITDGAIDGVSTETFLDRVSNSLSSLGITIRDGAVNIANLAVSRSDTEVARIKKMEMVDATTGEVYCTWIADGEWVKTKGDCSSSDVVSAVAVSASQPVAEVNAISQQAIEALEQAQAAAQQAASAAAEANVAAAHASAQAAANSNSRNHQEEAVAEPESTEAVESTEPVAEESSEVATEQATEQTEEVVTEEPVEQEEVIVEEPVIETEPSIETEQPQDPISMLGDLIKDSVAGLSKAVVNFIKEIFKDFAVNVAENSSEFKKELSSVEMQNFTADLFVPFKKAVSELKKLFGK